MFVCTEQHSPVSDGPTKCLTQDCVVTGTCQVSDGSMCIRVTHDYVQVSDSIR